MAITKPVVRGAVWAESGQTTEPSQGEQQSGFVAGKPSRRKGNWLWNWLDNAVQWLLRVGVPEYDAGQTYAVGARVIYGDGKYGWMRIGSGSTTGVAPDSDPTKWMRWGHTDEELDTAIDEKIGTLSGALAEGTIAATGSSTIGYARALRFPGSTDKLVCCRLTLKKGQGGWAETLTLSGAAAFAAGADGVQATVISRGANEPEVPELIAAVVTETTVVISMVGYNGTADMLLDVQIRGH